MGNAMHYSTVHCSERCKGFSLLELVIVIAIVGILSAMAIPRYANATNNYRVAAIARRMAADIAMTRNRARALSTSAAITFSVGTNSYQIPGMLGVGHTSSPYTVSLANGSYPGTLISATFGGSATLTFNGYGIPASAGTIQITSGSAKATITVDADSGKTTIQ